jgi:hypothetical protein
MIQGGAVIVSDTQDVWGNDYVLGLGEHANRIQAPPMLLDKTGDVLRWVNFESATPNYEIYQYGASYARRTSMVCLLGDFSLQMHSQHPTHEARLRVKNSDFCIGKIGLQFTFTADGSNGQFTFGFTRYSSTESWQAKIRYYMPTDSFYVYTPAGYVLFATQELLIDQYNFSSVKLVVDLETEKYVKLYMCNELYDLSEYNIYKSVSVTQPHLISELELFGPTGSTCCFIDNIIITHNEP